MNLYLVYYPSFRDAASDELFGIYESEELASKAIEESLFSEEDKNLLYIDVKMLNSRA